MTGAGKRALVTGGSMGLGRAMVTELASRGFEVVNVDRNEPQAEVPGVFRLCDLAARDQVDDLLDDLAAQAPFDLVILNAGISATGPFEDIPTQAMLRLLTVNLEAPIRIANGLRRSGGMQPGAHLVFVSSLSHFVGYPGAAAYAASKDGIAAYARSLAKASKGEGLTISCAFPGPLDTDHAERHAPQGAKASTRMVPEAAARLIIDAALSGQSEIVPGTANRLAALAGRLAPGLMTRVMGRIIFDKLGRTVF